MNIAVKKLSRFVAELLELDPATYIRPGRFGFERDNFTGRQIVIDSITAGTALSRSRKFDDAAEVMTHATLWQVPCTINFYGDTAWEDSTKFNDLLNSQKAYELQRDVCLMVGTIQSMTDVRLLTGEQYSGRIEATLNVQIVTSTDVETNRIDEAVLDNFLWEA